MYHCKINHALLVLLCILSALMFLCASVCNLDVESMVSKGVGLKHHQFWSAKSTDIVDCARICIKRKLCKSFNFDTSNRQCELNDDVFRIGMEVRSDTNLLYSNIAQWPAQVEPDCFHRPCGYDEMCIPGQLLGKSECSYTCLKLGQTPTRLSTASQVAPTAASQTPTRLSTASQVAPAAASQTPTRLSTASHVAPTAASQTPTRLSTASHVAPTVAPQTPSRLSTASHVAPTAAPVTQTLLPKSHEVSTSGSEDTSGPGLINVVDTGSNQLVYNSALAGTQFLTVFPRVATDGNEDTPLRRIYITSVRETGVRIKSSFLSLDQNVSVNTVISQDFPTLFTLTENDTVSDKVIEITADSPVNVNTLSLSYKNGTDQMTCDSFYNLPTNQLSIEYILITTDMTPQFSAVGTEDGTHVQITLSNKAEPKLNISINKFEVYTYFLNNVISIDDNLTGSIITSDKNVAVMSGGLFGSNPSSRNTTNDMSAMQIPGVSKWSNSCILSPFIPRIGFQYKIVACENNTYINMSTNADVTNIVIQRGKKNHKLAISVTATKPILVAMLSLRNDEKISVLGDSSMVQCIYFEYYAQSYTFFAPAIFDSFVRIIIQIDHVTDLRLNTLPRSMAINILSITSPTGIEYAILYIPVEQSTYYTLATTNGIKFGADLYGFTNTTQYSQKIGEVY